MAKFLTDAGLTTLVSKIKEQFKSVKNIADKNATDISTLKSDVSKIKSDVSSIEGKSQVLNITLGTAWSAEGDYFIQNVVNANITVDDTPIIDVVVDDNYKNQIAEWSKVYKAETYNNVIKFYAEEKTTIDLTVSVKR